MISIYRGHATLSALCVLLYSISSGASAASLGGHCSNWMTSSLNYQTTGAADVNATMVACTALSQSGDFETRYEPRTNTCLICNRDDWTASDSPGASWLHGAWTYRTSGGFKDTHELLSDGRTRQGGTWSVRDGKLVIEWPNGYLNEYPVQGPTRRLTGDTISPSGRRQESSLRRRDD